MTLRAHLIAIVAALTPQVVAADAVEFCLDGEFDLGARYQGMHPRGGEFYPSRWCVITEDDSDRVLLRMSGKSNPDMAGSWSVAFLPPDLVRIVNAASPPDVEFRGADARGEALRTRRIDPRRIAEEVGVVTGGRFAGFSARFADGRVVHLQTWANLPLRGRVPVQWVWDWLDPDAPTLQMAVDGQAMFRGRGTWRQLDDTETAALWVPTPAADPRQVPGENWPARVAMELVNLTDDVYLVQNVRTGFQHLVVDTATGLVVADAPAGWAELHQIPPADLVPGLAISGLSERLIDFLGTEFPEAPIRAVALTHAHDDHAGGARAFAAAGASVYAPAAVSEFLQRALNRKSMPPDRLLETGGEVDVTPVEDVLTLADPASPVALVPIGPGPHASASLGVHAVEQGIFFQSDLHVPRSDADSPRIERAVTECWFAAWAVANLPTDTIVVNTHSPVQTPVARLQKYLESDTCLGAAGET